MSVTWHAYQTTEIFRRISNPVPRVTWTPARYVLETSPDFLAKVTIGDEWILEGVPTSAAR